MHIPLSRETPVEKRGSRVLAESIYPTVGGHLH